VAISAIQDAAPMLLSGVPRGRAVLGEGIGEPDLEPTPLRLVLQHTCPSRWPDEMATPPEATATLAVQGSMPIRLKWAVRCVTPATQRPV